MSEKKYFKLKKGKAVSVYAFPQKISVIKGNIICDISKSNLTLEFIEKDNDFKQITESEFLEVFHEAQNEITLRYHRQFAAENDFIRNESLKSEGY